MIWLAAIACLYACCCFRVLLYAIVVAICCTTIRAIKARRSVVLRAVLSVLVVVGVGAGGGLCAMWCVSLLLFLFLLVLSVVLLLDVSVFSSLSMGAFFFVVLLISLIFLGPSGEVYGLITSFPLFWLLVVFVSGVVVVWCASVVLSRGGIFVVVVIPIDWNATNALYVFFVVFLFLGLVV